MFSGLRSRWTMPAACTAASPCGPARCRARARRAHAAPRQLLAQIVARQQLHDVVVVAARVLEEIGDLDEVVVRDPVDGARSAKNATRRPGRRELLAQHLDRDAPAEPHVLRDIDAAHAAFAEQLDEPIRAQPSAGRKPVAHVERAILSLEQRSTALVATRQACRSRHSTFRARDERCVHPLVGVYWSTLLIQAMYQRNILTSRDRIRRRVVHLEQVFQNLQPHSGVSQIGSALRIGLIRL